MTRYLKLVVLALLGMCMGCPLEAQQRTLSFQATALWRPIRQYEYWSHRADLSVRYHPCLKSRELCFQIGALMVAENPLLIGKSGTNWAHGAIGVDGGAAMRIGASLGQFIRRSDLGPLQYYRFLALGFEYRGTWDASIETQIWQFDLNAEGPPIHQARARVRVEIVHLELNYTRGAAPQNYDFLTGTMTFCCWRGFYGQVGNTPVSDPVPPSLRMVPMGYLGLGWRLSK